MPKLNTQHAVSVPSLGVVLHNLHTFSLVIYIFYIYSLFFLLSAFNRKKKVVATHVFAGTSRVFQ